MKKLLLSLTLCALALFLCPAAQAATWYVDSTATGSNNGTSWANAWTNIDQINGVGVGDVVYISGGPSGSTRTYTMTNYWKPAGGTVSSRITYQIGQDAAHNGTAIFNAVTPGATWIDLSNETPSSNINISGDAGDGLMHFKLVGYGSAIYSDKVSNFHISYIDASSGIGDGGALFENPNPSGVEIDHWNVLVSDMNADRFMFALFNGSTWDAGGSIHHCTIKVPTLANGVGADALQWVGSGFSIHDNLIIGYLANYTGNQHQDGWQAGGGSYIKIYNNTFVGISNYAIYGESAGGGYSHVRVYNNIVYGPGGGGIVFSSSQLDATMDDVLIANNIVVDDVSQPYVFIFYGKTITGANDAVRNNISVNNNNSSDYWIDDPRIANTNNVQLTSTQAAADFVNYTPNNWSNDDLHLRSAASALINAGVSLSSYFTTDKDGNARPSTGPWDIGAYEYVPLVIYGDVSGNGSITAYDAALAAQYAVALITLSDEQITKADVSGNGSVSAYDATLIAQRAVGLISKFPIEG